MKVKKVALSLGLTWAILFVFCMFWGFWTPSADLKSFHEKLLIVSYPGFSMTIQGFILGIVESFIYGLVIGGLFAYIYKKVK
ncbi:MAG: hypothetical protein K940chlam8_00803 [Chlamydiae bacterium]|nr:hypothetical protein [Chlamydiota bacterium]